jgi:hypothetical protein
MATLSKFATSISVLLSTHILLAQVKYSRVEIFIPHNKIGQLAAKGIEADHGQYNPQRLNYELLCRKNSLRESRGAQSQLCTKFLNNRNTGN